MIHAARTNQMIYDANPGERYAAYTASLRVRKPAAMEANNLAFGFPASRTSVMCSNDPMLRVNGNVVRARIAASSRREDDENGLYAVWATSCRHPPPPPPPAPVLMTAWEILSQPLPELKVADAETLATPSLPRNPPHKPNDLTNSCSADGECVAKTPVGYIWLDRKWRDGQEEQCVMEFLALAGRKNEKWENEELWDDHPGDERWEVEEWKGKECEDKWVITLLMCLQRMEKNGHHWGHERVQILDCEISEQGWLEAGAENEALRLE